MYVKDFFYRYQGYLLRSFLRRAVALQRKIKNFGPNVVYYFFGYHVGHQFRELVGPPGRGIQPANPRRSLFENCFISNFDTGFRIYVKNCAYRYQGYLLRSFLRRAVALQRKIKNFGPNVVHCFFGYHVGHKFRELVGPPGREIHKNTTCESKEVTF